MVQNSYFLQRYDNKKILVLVPHQDDEINVAGNFICSMSKMGADIYVAYSTNGDYEYKAAVRIKEAIAALAIMGVNEDHIVFMGYGDSYNTFEGAHISDAYDRPTVSRAGHNETYCEANQSDYSFIKSGNHSRYCRNNFLSDLESIILDIKPELLVCVDFDQHPDHRWLSIAFDEVMHNLLSRKNNTYFPTVWKSFAYATAFSAKADLLGCENLLATERPNVNNTLNYLIDVIDYANWEWKNRIRIPVLPENRINYLIYRNRLVKAMLKHKSQYMILHANSVINSDEIFWEHRTDSLAYSAKVMASSGETSFLTDFKYVNTRNIKDKTPRFNKYLWKPDADDIQKMVSFAWEQVQTVNTICIYNGINIGKVKTIRCTFDDGFSNIYSLANGEHNFYITLESAHFIRTCIIEILEHDEDAGISEIEIFGEARESFIKPFIKLLLDDNYTYKHIMNEKINRVVLSVYKYKCDDEIVFEIMSGNAKIEGNNLIIETGEKEVVIRAKSRISPDIFDEVKLVRDDVLFYKIRLFQYFDNVLLFYYRIKRKLHL